MSKEKSRLPFRMQPETMQKTEQWYTASNCRSKNEFVEKAVNFYADYLALNSDNQLLPKAVLSTIEGRLGLLEKKLSAVMFNHAVELDMLGEMYLEGVGVAQDKSQGLYWLSESAKQGHPYASAVMERRDSVTPLSVFCAVNRIFHHMSRIFRDNSLPRSQPGGIQIDRKRWAEMQDKRIAMGHKEDDHPDYGPTISL